MKISDLILAVGDDNVKFQSLDHAAIDLNYSAKTGTTIKFGTDQPLDLNGTRDLGMIVWLPRDSVAAALSKPNAPGADLTMKMATQASNLSVHATRLADALQVLTSACEDADRMEELPFNIDGSMIDEANAALSAYRSPTTPADGGA